MVIDHRAVARVKFLHTHEVSETFHYRFYLRDKPALAELAAERAESDEAWLAELVRIDDHTWKFGEMSLTVTAHATPPDAEISAEWSGQIRWTIDSVGEFDSPRGGTFDDWYGLALVICDRWSGALLSIDDGKVFLVGEALAGPPAAPWTREQLVDYVDRAPGDDAIMKQLEEGDALCWDGKPAREHLVPLLLERARNGASVIPWRWAVRRAAEAMPKLATEEARRKFASAGTLAAALVQEREYQRAAAGAPRFDPNAERARDLLEKRRRGGELLAGIPADVRALALRDRKAAAATYAARYELPISRARTVIDANVPLAQAPSVDRKPVKRKATRRAARGATKPSKAPARKLSKRKTPRVSSKRKRSRSGR